MSFDRVIERMIGPNGHEGVYSNDPKDPGNWTGGRVGSGGLKGTKYGISAAAFPHLDIRNLSYEDAKRIYKREYWDRCRCDEWAEPIAEAVFDMSVNQGPGDAIRTLQRAAKVTADGVIGPITRAAVKRRDLKDLLLHFFAWRGVDYGDVARKNPANWEHHKFGWMIRLLKEYETAVTS